MFKQSNSEAWNIVYLIKLRSRKYSYFVIASAVNCLEMLGKPKLTAFQAINILFFSFKYFSSLVLLKLCAMRSNMMCRLCCFDLIHYCTVNDKSLSQTMF